MIENKKYFVAPVGSSKACQFTSYYHYSGQPFRQAKLNLGVFDKNTQELKGVMQWGQSYAMDIKLDRYVQEPITKNQYFELNRFCMAEAEGKNSESQALSLGIKYIKQKHPEIKLLVSYSGRREGKYGYIYQATNWEYLGFFISNAFWNLDGEEVHTLTVAQRYRNSIRKWENLDDFLCHTYSTAIQTWTKQFIYILRLDKKLTAATPILKYPKPTTEYPIKVKEQVHCRDVTQTLQLKKDKGEEPHFFYDPYELLFSYQALRRRAKKERGESIHVGTRNSVAQYSLQGKLETTYLNLSEAARAGYGTEGVKSAAKKQKVYKNKFFVLYPMNREPEPNITIPFICIIEGQGFYKVPDIALFLGVSRQAVYASKKRNGKILAGKKVEWITD